MKTIQPLSRTKGISRLLNSWYYPEKDSYYRDSEHGGRPPALAALLLDRFEAQIKEAELEGDPPKRGYVNTTTKNDTGIVGITKVNYRREGNRYYSVSASRLKSTNYFSIPVDKYGEELAFKIALKIRHQYSHYVYGERYHQERQKNSTPLPSDSLLKKYNIKPIPDFEPYKYHEEQSEIEYPEPESKGKGLLAKTRTEKNNYYEKYPDLPKVQGVAYVNSVHGFTATFPGKGNELGKGSRTFTIGKYGVKKAYVQAVNVRHQFCKKYYGKKYNQKRNDDDNLLPSDELLKTIGITP